MRRRVLGVAGLALIGGAILGAAPNVCAALPPPEANSPEDLDCLGVHGGRAVMLDCGCNLRCTPTPVPVYIFSNIFFPVSSKTSSTGAADTSITLSQEYGTRVSVQVGSSDKFGGIFNIIKERKDPAMLKWDKEWGNIGRKKTIVIAGDGTFVGAWDTDDFRAQHAGFSDANPLTLQGIRENYNTYKDRIITLPDGTLVQVIENATASPLLVDLDQDGTPSLMAFGWTKTHAPHYDLTRYRQFRFGGAGSESSWEWIGSDDGLLVWLPSMAIDKPGDSQALFGTDTWGKSWQHGFEPLATLDKDSDQLVRDEELRDVGVWRDRNGDAIAQASEVTTATQAGISAISLDVTGAPHAPKAAGGVDIKGRAVDVWDWWSARNPLDSLKKVGSLKWTSESVPGVAAVSFMSLAENSHFEMLPEGQLEFYQDAKGAWFVRAMATASDGTPLDLLYPATAGAGMLRWGMKSKGVLSTHGIFDGEGEPIGITSISDGRFATWRIVSHEGAAPWTSGPAVPGSAPEKPSPKA